MSCSTRPATSGGGARLGCCAGCAATTPPRSTRPGSDIGAHQPVWLRLPDSDDAVVELVIAWTGTPSWDESFAFLTTHADPLLGDAGEAAVEHLIDANPGNAILELHLQLLDAARTGGVEATHAQFRTQLLVQELVTVLTQWVAASATDESRIFLVEHAEQLLTDEAEAVPTALVDDQPDDPELLAHLGLLGLARQVGVEAAYAGDAGNAAALLLPAARLRAGRQPTDGQAHVEHALAALFHGLPDEAGRAIASCVEHTASWERRELRRRLAELLATQPDVDPTPLLQALAEPPGPA